MKEPRPPRNLERPKPRMCKEQRLYGLLNVCYQYCSIAPLTAAGYSEEEAQRLLEDYTKWREGK